MYEATPAFSDDARGLTKFQYIATHLLQGILSNPEIIKGFKDTCDIEDRPGVTVQALAVDVAVKCTRELIARLPKDAGER